jgi:Pyruvate/2-oxoacid:ferredoxin oxidoreductase delta subunit
MKSERLRGCYSLGYRQNCVTQLQILLKVEFTTLCHVQKGATCLRFEPGCWVTSSTSGEKKKTGLCDGCGLCSSECSRPIRRMGWVQGALFEYRNFKSLNTVTTIQSYMIPLKQTEMNVTCFKSRLAIFAPHVRVKYRHVNDLKDSIPRSVCIVGNYIFWAAELRFNSRQG